MPDKNYSKAEIARAATNVRKHILKLAIERGGCYLTQACSSAEIVTSLYMNILNLGCPDAQPFPGVPSPTNMDYPKGSLYNGEQTPDRDRLFVSCCHYASVIYCALVEAGRLSPAAIDKFNVDGWNMEMIGAEHSPGFENTAGSLGQTVSIAAGELEEGQDWECFQAAAFYKLDNFVVIADINHQQLEGWTKDVMNIEPLEERMKAFGWAVTRINGHDLDALEEAGKMEHPGKPLMILCDTNPAQGIPLLEPMIPKHFVRIPADRRAEFEAFCAQM